jgi:cytochrome P450
MRFGQLEIKTVATLVLQRFRPAVPAAHSLHVRQMPTLSPEGGLPMALREREAL